VGNSSTIKASREEARHWTIPVSCWYPSALVVFGPDTNAVRVRKISTSRTLTDVALIAHLLREHNSL
jgi:hypothetical protein